jgi:hypothetical protein
LIYSKRFIDIIGELFQGKITEVLDSGHIQITTPSGEERIFAFKEVEFVF